MTTVKDYFHFQIIFSFEEKVMWIILQKEKTTSKHCPLWNKKMITLYFHPAFYCLCNVNGWKLTAQKHKNTEKEFVIQAVKEGENDRTSRPSLWELKNKKQQERGWPRILGGGGDCFSSASNIQPKAFIKRKGQCRRIKDGQETEGVLSVLFNCKFCFFLLFG